MNVQAGENVGVQINDDCDLPTTLWTTAKMPDVITFDPKEDITTYELARSICIITAASFNILGRCNSNLDKNHLEKIYGANVIRHFKFTPYEKWNKNDL